MPSIPSPLMAHCTYLAKPQPWLNLSQNFVPGSSQRNDWSHVKLFILHGHWLDFPSLFPPSWVPLSHISPLPKALTPPPQSSFMGPFLSPFAGSAPSPWPLPRHSDLFPIYTPSPGHLIPSQGCEHHLFLCDFQICISCPDFSLGLQTWTSSCLFYFFIGMFNSKFLNLGTFGILDRIILCCRGLFCAL